MCVVGYLHAARLPSFPEPVDVLLQAVDIWVLGLVLPRLLDSWADRFHVFAQLIDQVLQKRRKYT